MHVRMRLRLRFPHPRSICVAVYGVQNSVRHTLSKYPCFEVWGTRAASDDRDGCKLDATRKPLLPDPQEESSTSPRSRVRGQLRWTLRPDVLRAAMYETNGFDAAFSLLADKRNKRKTLTPRTGRKSTAVSSAKDHKGRDHLKRKRVRKITHHDPEQSDGSGEDSEDASARAAKQARLSTGRCCNQAKGAVSGAVSVQPDTTVSNNDEEPGAAASDSDTNALSIASPSAAAHQNDSEGKGSNDCDDKRNPDIKRTVSESKSVPNDATLSRLHADIDSSSA